MRLICLVVVCWLCSCGKKDHSQGQTKVFYEIPSDIEQVLKEQKFLCAAVEGMKCPVGLARLFTVKSHSPSRELELCTGYLLGPKILVTNFHCLSTEQHCQNTYISVYLDGYQVTTKCEQIVLAQDDGRPLESKAIDVSIIELEDEVWPVAAFTIAEQLPRTGSEVVLWVIDHVDLYTGRITEFKCRYQKNYHSIELGHCPAIPGNSGSPVLNEEGKVFGVLWGSTTEYTIDEFTPLEIRRSLNEYSYVTSIKHFKNVLRGL